MKFVAYVISVVVKFFITILAVSVFFTLFTIGTCNTYFNNLELRSEKSALESEVETLTASLNSVKEENRILEDGFLRKSNEVESAENQRDVYASDFRKEKSKNKRQQKTIAGLSRETAELKQELTEATAFANEVNNERNRLRKNVDVLLTENQQVSNEKENLLVELKRRDTLEKSLYASIQHFKTRTTGLEASNAAFAARELEVSEGLQAIETAKKRRVVVYGGLVVLGASFGVFLSGYRRKKGMNVTVRWPKLSSKSTWSIIRSYFF